MTLPHTQEQGIGMIEILLVLVLFTGLATIVGVVSLHLKDDVRAELDRVQALALAHEGINALHSLRDIDADTLVAGTHGLAIEDGSWTLTESPLETGIFTRTIAIEVGANDLFIATSTVSWEGIRGDSIALTTTLYDIYETYGASQYVIPEFTALTHIDLVNTDSEPHTIETLMCSWEGTALLKEIQLGSTTVFTTATSSALQSGTEAPIENGILDAGEATSISIIFTEPVLSTVSTLQLVLEDGTVRNSLQLTE
ncbi:MAG: hypothetical protein UV60_C0024G0009 [Parcubacteria group bacterium GW2011_GWA2_43_11]|nr:MAG: hypothetical protein UV60_C0024G0009 [Parcubacteria group bacterium GW2011_GWA2_43_11]